MESVLITGGTGMVGKALTKLLLFQGYSVMILSRKQLKNSPPSRENTFKLIKKGKIIKAFMLQRLLLPRVVLAHLRRP